MKILVVGLGGIGQRHIRNLRSLLGAQVELLAVDPRRDVPVLTDQLQVEAGSTLEKKYDLRIFQELEAALAVKPDAVFICNPTSLHVPTAIRAAETGCDLFIEKPLSHNLEKVEDLIHLAESRSLKTAVGYQMRFHPCMQRLHELVQRNQVGRILSVRAEVGEYLPGWHTYEDYRQLYASRQQLGGGVILTQIHEFDYLYWLFGTPRRVFALGGHLSDLELDVEDTAETLMEYELDGRSVPISVHQDYLQRPAQRTCEVIGAHGRILADLVGLSVIVFDGEGRQVEATSYAGYQRNQMFLDELSLFLAPSIPSGETGARASALVSIHEGAQSLKMALSARESLRTGKVIEFERNQK